MKRGSRLFPKKDNGSGSNGMNPTPVTSELVSGTCAVSARAFAQLYVSHFSQVRAFLARAGCESHSLDDLAQETFLRAWHARSRFSGTVRFQTWLLGIARNTARESWRKARNAQPLDRQPSNDPLSQCTKDQERAEMVRAAVDQLPPKQRTAISLVYLDGVTQKDAANQTNCAQDAFRQRLAHGRMRLRTLLRAEQID